MEIEEVAATHPERIVREWADPALGLQAFQARALAFGLGLSGDQFKAGVGADPEPLPRLPRQGLLAGRDQPAGGDARTAGCWRSTPSSTSTTTRSSATPRSSALRDVNEEDPLDVEASKHGLNYIKLDGSVGCMVNGAGLAMATMDIVKLAGGEPANFLDVGGGASPEQIENAFRILSSDPSVKAVFINVFGGILRCDRLAEGLIAAVQKLGAPAARRRADGGHERGARARRCSPSPGSTSRAPPTWAMRGRLRARSDASLGRGAQRRVKAMSILVDRSTRVVVQGITGREGTFHALRCKEYGTQVVGGVTPGKGGTTHEGFPVWNTVEEAVREAGRRLRADLRAARRRRRRDHGGGRRGHAAGRLHHRGHSRGRHGAGQGVPGQPRDAGSSARTVPGSSRPARPRSASCPATSTRRARSAWSRAAAP